VPGGRSFTTNGVDVIWTQTTNSLDRAPATGGALTPVASGGGRGVNVVADQNEIYYSGLFTETIDRVSISGGSPTEFAVYIDVKALALDATNLYALRITSLDGGSEGDVVRIPRDGSPATTLVFGESWPGTIAADGSYVYWTSAHGCKGSDAPGPASADIKRMPIGGGTIETLGTHAMPWQPFAVGPTRIAWVTTDQCGASPAIGFAAK
jgi:hypothetical protein